MKKTQLFKRTLSALLAVTLLAGCGGGGASSSTSPAASGAPAASGTADAAASTAEPGKKKYENVTINFIYPGAVWSNVMAEHLSEFEAQTGIKVNAQQFTNDQLAQKIAVSMAAGGKDIDVVNYAPQQNGQLYKKNGWIVPLDQYIASSPDFDIGDFQEAAISSCTLDGEIYGIPWLTEREVVSYNKKMFEEKGIEIPKTFEELMTAAEKLTDESKGVVGIAMRGKGAAAVTQFSGFLYGYGGNFITDGKASINTPEAIEAFKYYGDIVRNYGPKGAINMDWQETQALFSQGRAAMRVDCDSQYAFCKDPKSSLVADDVGVFKMPAGSAGSKPYNIAAWCLGVSSGSPNKEAAWEFINWMCGKEMDIKAMAAGNPSARKSTWQDTQATASFPTELVSVINETIPDAVGNDRPAMINVGDARTIIGNVIIAAIEGKDVQAEANKANEALQKLLDKEAAEK